ncbi:FAD-linked oxidase C-terminal domain-containing protein [Arthrobacter oryzae]|uniref:FAD-binding oxidoreductase n=1 Tax=Arthrobacter oryzae TaxID=409290 RepID=UPI002863DAD9|nr:FAD-linked oxidase C-terminal domain-containing protein [Arthrobacter oryzae]MDR6504839.1 glycolate oxidase [Arthrobacter oryzae]
MTTVQELRRQLGQRVLTDPADLARYSADASRAIPDGLPAGVLAARSTEDVVAGIKWAARHQVPVSVRGAGTGLAGGAVAYKGGLVISLARMDAILSIDPDNRLAQVQAGVVTADLDAAAAEYGLMYAPDPASYRQSTIGGNIATNAGGLRCVKYGVTSDSVAGLAVVLANGDVISTGAKTRKNVAGYDLTSLFVGSEGTLGIVTGATLRLHPRPEGKAVTFRATFPSAASAGKAVTAIMGSSVVPDVMELMDRASVRIVEQFHPTGLSTGGAAILVGQFISPTSEADAAVAARLCTRAGATGVEQADGDVLVEARRVSGKALDARGLRASCDVAVPISRLAEMFIALEQIGSANNVEIPTFAHAGDGNLHPSVVIGDETPEAYAEAERILDLITDQAILLGGTISGEHGIGSLKVGSLSKQLEPATLAAHRLVKTAFDPLGILTPGRAV